MLNFDDTLLYFKIKNLIIENTFCFEPKTQMPLTIVELISIDRKISNLVPCQIDLGAESSFLYEKHLKNINYIESEPIRIGSSTGENEYLKINNFFLTFHLINGKKIETPITKYSKPIITLRKDESASITVDKNDSKNNMRWIYGNLGRDILIHNKIKVFTDLHSGIVRLEE